MFCTRKRLPYSFLNNFKQHNNIFCHTSPATQSHMPMPLMQFIYWKDKCRNKTYKGKEHFFLKPRNKLFIADYIPLNTCKGYWHCFLYVSGYTTYPGFKVYNQGALKRLLLAFLEDVYSRFEIHHALNLHITKSLCVNNSHAPQEKK